MAGCALTGDDTLRGRVVKGRGYERASRRVTGIAREGRRDVAVAAWLGRGRSPLDVTSAVGATAGGHADMGKACAHPRGGAVTGVAGLAGGHVIRRLTLGHAVVMALTALTRRYAGVTEGDNTPRCGRGVALIARLTCYDVIRGLEGAGLNAAALGVTGFAFLGRAFKVALHVTGFAG